MIGFNLIYPLRNPRFLQFAQSIWIGALISGIDFSNTRLLLYSTDWKEDIDYSAAHYEC